MGDISEHFSESEFACHDCGKTKVSQILIDSLEDLRALADKPIIIHSGYRCPKHNKSVGGVSSSQHLLGQAADLTIDGLTAQEMYALAIKVPEFLNGGVGLYDGGFIHVDVRGRRARWSRIRGVYGPIEDLLNA